LGLNLSSTECKQRSSQPATHRRAGREPRAGGLDEAANGGAGLRDDARRFPQASARFDWHAFCIATDQLPTGAATLLFSDIEGSTRLVRPLRDRYDEVLAEHQGLLRTAFVAHGGHELDTQGDSFFVAFSSAGDAVSAALESQLALLSHRWPDGIPVKVRIGIHSGRTVARDDRYTGLAIHRAARNMRGSARRPDPRFASDASVARGQGRGLGLLAPRPRRVSPQGFRPSGPPLPSNYQRTALVLSCPTVSGLIGACGGESCHGAGLAPAARRRS